MALHSNSSQPTEDMTVSAEEIAGTTRLLEPAVAPVMRGSGSTNDDSVLLTEALQAHGLGNKVIERLIGFAIAPTHTKRPLDRLSIALGAHFNFLPLDDILQTPVLLFGASGAGVTTLAAKLAARYDERQILVVSAGGKDAAATAQLEEYLEVLDLPLAVAEDAASLKKIVAGASGRKVIIDAACGASADQSNSKQIQGLIEASGARGLMVLSAETESDEAVAGAEAAAALGARGIIVTRFDTARYLGPALMAADAAKLAFIGASVTQHFAFGLRALTPENLSRRLMSSAVHAERWRAAPL
jgi:flagellar biosynthesis protein FlhF